MSLALAPKIIFEDPSVIVLSKPAGLLSQGGPLDRTSLVDWLREYLNRNYVGLIHRLDTNTSGIMLIAKRTKAAQRLSEDLRLGKIYRTYLAWLQGNIQAPTSWSHYLRKDEAKNLVKVKTADFEGSKPARLKLNPRKNAVISGEIFTLCELELETGRSHQIRAQAAFEGHSVLGDQKYGNKIFINRLGLHSHRLRFDHPISKDAMEFEDPLPESLSVFPSTNPHDEL